jgi:hypothetical protein
MFLFIAYLAMSAVMEIGVYFVEGLLFSGKVAVPVSLHILP